jgi:hypothetical protein
MGHADLLSFGDRRHATPTGNERLVGALPETIHG